MRRIVFFCFLVVASNAQIYKLCTTDDVTPNTCKTLQKGNSRIKCLEVTDSAECAIRLSRGEADFGIFYPEESLLAYQFYRDDIVPIFQLRNRETQQEEFEFQSVAIVPATLKPIGHASDFVSLKNAGLCHPGFSTAQWWNDYILKYFERTVITSECRDDISAAENEAQHLKNFFGKACRPGEWVADASIDALLKKKYPELCDLCEDRGVCAYRNMENHGHTGALDCLTSGRGKVAYVALYHARQYFSSNDTDYQFMCADGTTQPLSTETPCAWIKQPWGVIAARKAIANDLSKSLKQWLTPPTLSNEEDWVQTLNKILQDENVAISLNDDTSLAAYLSKGREVDLPRAGTCKLPPIKWCTIGDLETEKCKWVATEAKALGIEPQITCHNSSSTFQCFRDIHNQKADIMVIDSNYGHLARTVFGLSTVMYSETRNDKNSVVVAMIREPEPGDTPITSLKSLKGRKACFPEYGGIAWMSFVHIARVNGLISSSSCDYPKQVAYFLSGACAPGIRDDDHSNRIASQRRMNILSTLCSACPSNVNNSCAASNDNPYYKDRGAFECLSSGAGDIAFLEINNLDRSAIDERKFRLLCKNGSLANLPGFVYDEMCPWSITIDSEIVGRKNSSYIDILDTSLALMKMNNWLGYRLYARRPINMYDKFNDTSDLLFKDSTIGLKNVSSMMHTAEEYKKLFNHVETCTGGALAMTASFIQIALLSAIAVLIGRLA